MIKKRKAAGGYQTAINKTQKHSIKMDLPNPVVFYTGELNKIKTNEKTGTGLCPFHDDHKASFAFYTDNGNFKCFTCGVKGSMVNFCQIKYGLNYADALKYLCRRG